MFVHDNAVSIEKVFGVRLLTSSEMASAIEMWDNISTGRPSWLDYEDGIETVNMAKHISDTRAKLTCLDIGISCGGPKGTQSVRADFDQKLIDELLKKLPDQLCTADRLGGMIIKWNGASWDFVPNGSFGITAKKDNGEITGAVFATHTVQGGDHYTRLEYHRFEGNLYYVSNRAFKDRQTPSGLQLGQEVPLTQVTEWAELLPESPGIENLERPLFGYYRVPGDNIIDPDSPLGCAVYAGALHELKAIDIAISRKDSEVEDSKHITFVGQQVIQNAQNRSVKLPRFVQGLGLGLNDGDTTAVHEHVPTMLTEDRIKDINFDLSMAGVKCGFSEGVFVLDGQTGMITATQVEADDRDTIQTIKVDRDALRDALSAAIYGMDALVTLYRQAPLGPYELTWNWGDITYNYEEDKANWKSYAAQGWVPKWLYFTKFEGMSEEDAKAITQEAEQANMDRGLFGVE